MEERLIGSELRGRRLSSYFMDGETDALWEEIVRNLCGVLGSFAPFLALY